MSVCRSSLGTESTSRFSRAPTQRAIDHMPWTIWRGKPNAFAVSGYRWIGLWSPDTPAYPYPVQAWRLDAGADDKQRSDYLVAREAPRELGYRAGGFAQQLGGDCADLAARDAGAAAAPAK